MIKRCRDFLNIFFNLALRFLVLKDRVLDSLLQLVNVDCQLLRKLALQVAFQLDDLLLIINLHLILLLKYLLKPIIKRAFKIVGARFEFLDLVQAILNAFLAGGILTITLFNLIHSALDFAGFGFQVVDSCFNPAEGLVNAIRIL